jgi:hypothetical protein
VGGLFVTVHELHGREYSWIEPANNWQGFAFDLGFGMGLGKKISYAAPARDHFLPGSLLLPGGSGKRVFRIATLGCKF